MVPCISAYGPVRGHIHIHGRKGSCDYTSIRGMTASKFRVKMHEFTLTTWHEVERWTIVPTVKICKVSDEAQHVYA